MNQSKGGKRAGGVAITDSGSSIAITPCCQPPTMKPDRVMPPPPIAAEDEQDSTQSDEQPSPTHRISADEIDGVAGNAGTHELAAGTSRRKETFAGVFIQGSQRAIRPQEIRSKKGIDLSARSFPEDSVVDRELVPLIENAVGPLSFRVRTWTNCL